MAEQDYAKIARQKQLDLRRRSIIHEAHDSSIQSLVLLKQFFVS